MGTKPTKIGIVVPDDFELPEGYVRHFQANEDGELLPAILLFHPDYEWVDDADEGISANVIAGYFHDHILVPWGRSADALAALKRLANV